QQSVAEAQRPPPPGRARQSWLGMVRELVEVSVVPCRLDRLTERRVDEPAGARRGPKRAARHGLELGRDSCELTRGSVDPAQLAVRSEAAEHPISLMEELLDASGLVRGRTADGDLAAHGREVMRAHELLVATCGVDCEGAIAPAPESSVSSKNESEESEFDATFEVTAERPFAALEPGRVQAARTSAAKKTRTAET